MDSIKREKGKIKKGKASEQGYVNPEQADA
jgi:hypothetical protein